MLQTALPDTLLFFIIFLCYVSKTKQNEESILRMFGRDITTLVTAGTIQQPIQAAEAISPPYHQGKDKEEKVAHDITVL